MGLSIVLLLRASMQDPRVNFERSHAAVLALKRPSIPDERNAWIAYQHGIAARSLWTGLPEDDPQYKTDDDVKFFVTPEAQAHWKANAFAISKLHSAGQMQECDFGVDHAAKPFSSLPYQSFRECANLLALDARCQAHCGSHKLAAKSLHTIRSIARHMESEPVLTQMMLAAAVDDIANDAFAAIVRFDTPVSVEDLEEYKVALQAAGNPYQRGARCLKYEGTIFLYTFDGAAAGLMRPVGSAFLLQLTPLFYGSDRDCYVAAMEDGLQHLATGRMPEALNVTLKRHQRGPVILTSASRIPLRAWLALVLVEEKARLAVTAAAFLQFRARYRHDPDSVADLVPEFLPQIPRGVFHDEAIRWTSEPLRTQPQLPYVSTFYEGLNAVRIYTLGANGVDNAGNGNHDCGAALDDGVFLVPVCGPALEAAAK